MFDDLLKGRVFLEFVCLDSTKQIAETTLNPEILESYGAKPVRDYYFDLRKKQYVKIREDVKEINILSEYPIYEAEVYNFAARFL